MKTITRTIRAMVESVRIAIILGALYHTAPAATAFAQELPVEPSPNPLENTVDSWDEADDEVFRSFVENGGLSGLGATRALLATGWVAQFTELSDDQAERLTTRFTEYLDSPAHSLVEPESDSEIPVLLAEVVGEEQASTYLQGAAEVYAADLRWRVENTAAEANLTAGLNGDESAIFAAVLGQAIHDHEILFQGNLDFWRETEGMAALSGDTDSIYDFRAKVALRVSQYMLEQITSDIHETLTANFSEEKVALLEGFLLSENAALLQFDTGDAQAAGETPSMPASGSDDSSGV